MHVVEFDHLSDLHGSWPLWRRSLLRPGPTSIYSGFKNRWHNPPGVAPSTLRTPSSLSISKCRKRARVFHAKGAPHPVPGWARTLSRSHPRPDAKAWLLASPSSAQSFLAMFGQGKGQRGDGRKEMNRIGEAVAKKGYLSEWFPSDVKTKSRGGQSVSQCIHINCTVVCYPSAVPIT